MIGIRRYDDSWVAGDICWNYEQLITIQIMTPESIHKFPNTLSLHNYINAYMHTCTRTYMVHTYIHTHKEVNF